jgi:hypothetical protein
MTRGEFKKVAEQALEQLVSTAEQRLNRQFSRRFCFTGLTGKEIVADGDVAEFLTNWVFVDDSHISPCVDLFLEELLPDGRLLFRGYRAGYKPCPYGEHITYTLEGHDSGRVGPFKIGCHNFVERLKS